MDISEKNAFKTLSMDIHNRIPHLILEFVEHNDKTNQSYPVDLEFSEIKYLDNERVVLHGHLIVSLRPYGIGAIEYNFNTKEFYRVSFSDKTSRSRRLHTLLPHNQETINNLITFIRS